MEAGADLNPMVAVDDEAKPLRSKLLAVPDWRDRYLGYVHDIAERRLDWQKLKPSIAEWQALIEADVKNDTRKIYSTEAFASGKLREFIQKRREFLLR